MAPSFDPARHAPGLHPLRSAEEAARQVTFCQPDLIERAVELARVAAAAGCREPDAREDAHATPLMWAACYGQTPLVERLIEHSSLDARHGLDGRSALHFASENGHGDCVEMLLAAGANPAARDSRGRTPLMSACSELARDGAQRAVELLLPLSDMEARDHGGRSPIEMAESCESHPHVVSALRQACDARKQAQALEACLPPAKISRRGPRA